METFLTDKQFDLFKSLIYDQSGIHFSATNRSILESRLKERLRLAKLDDLTTYYNLILKNQNELKVLLDSVTTNLTRFFRNKGHFQSLENYVIPDMIEQKRKKNEKRIRVWSAGCSTGEEPYSLVVSLSEKIPRDIKIEVIGSDLSLKSIMVANEGFYNDARMSGVPEMYLGKYFDKKRDGFQVKQEAKGLIKFDYHNLKHDSGHRNIDIIFCRNVIIYFDAAAQKDVINKFWGVLNNYSYLFIGHSESLFGMNTEFEFVKTQWASVYRKNKTSPG